MITDQNNYMLASRQLSLLVDMNQPVKVFEEVRIIIEDIFNPCDLDMLASIFDRVVSLFNGNLRDYKASDTPYHNLKHSTDVFLAMARLIHGAHVNGFSISKIDTEMGLISALMHDTGYVQKQMETHTSGAELAGVHERRSVAFMREQLSDIGCGPDIIDRSENLILCTELNVPFNQHQFNSDIDKILGQMIATADLLAQTADRNYLEKLPLLFQELQVAGVYTHQDEFSFIKDAPKFNVYMRQRFANQLDSVNRFMTGHFKRRWDIDLNLYQESIDRSMTYLKTILSEYQADFHSHLRRIQGTH